LKGHCTHCNGLLEFPAESTGMTMDCPLCGQPTELLLARPVEEPTIPKVTLIWTSIAVLVLAGGLVGALIALNRAERLVKRKKTSASNAVAAASRSIPTAAEIAATNGFGVSSIRLEKVEGSSLVYATGSLTNITLQQRFGVRVELDLLNATGQKIGTASDYQGVLEPNGQWQFKALVADPKSTVSAKLADIKQQP